MWARDASAALPPYICLVMLDGYGVRTSPAVVARAA